MKLALLSAVIIAAYLTGCAHLKDGWAKITYLEGAPSEVMVCEMKLKGEDMTAKCLSLEEALRQVNEMERGGRERTTPDWSI